MLDDKVAAIELLQCENKGLQAKLGDKVAETSVLKSEKEQLQVHLQDCFEQAEGFKKNLQRLQTLVPSEQEKIAKQQLFEASAKKCKQADRDNADSLPVAYLFYSARAVGPCPSSYLC